MRARRDCTTGAASAPAPPGELVSILVPDDHPLRQLQRALDWEAITAVMVKHWRAAGKNVDGGPGRSWPVGLYVPLVVLCVVKAVHSRQMEDYLNESVVARVFLGLSHQRQMPVRDHASIARAVQALGAEGVAEVNQWVIRIAHQFGFTGAEILSSDTTVQEPLMAYPNEPGILQGLAQRVERALKNLQSRGGRAAQAGIETAHEIYRTVKQHHLWAKTKEQRRQRLTQIVEQTEQLIKQSQAVIETVAGRASRVKAGAVAKLEQMGQVAARLLPQVKHWIKTGQVAADKIIHAGLIEARAIVTDKAGRRVKFGFKWLIHRLTGGYLFGQRVAARASQYQMPIVALKASRAVFSETATPRLVVYDRGGRCATTVRALKKSGVKRVGVPPVGQGKWLVGKKDQQVVHRERGKTEGSIGRLKSQKDRFSRRSERSEPTQEAVGQRAIVSANLNTLMRGLVIRGKAAKAASRESRPE
jgi:hypothetical protein